MKIDSHQHFWNYNIQEYGWIDESMAPIMVCPSDESPETRVYTGVIDPNFTVGDFNNVTSYNQTKRVGSGLVEVESSYGYNLNLGLYEVLMLGINDPSSMLVNFDAESLLGNSLKENGASKPDLENFKNIVDSVLDLRHLDEANLLFADGHVSQGTDENIDESNLTSLKWRTTGEGYFVSETNTSL